MATKYLTLRSVIQFEPRLSCSSVEIFDAKAFIKVHTPKSDIPLPRSHTQVDQNGSAYRTFSDCKL